MSATFTLAAELRTDTGKGASRRLRHTSQVPAIIYGAGKEPTMLAIRHDDIMHAVEDEAFFSHILTIEIKDGATENVIIKDLQRHPAKVQIMHADFQRFDENQSLHVNVPLHFINEDVCAGVKAGGLIAHLMTEIEVACLATDLPEYIEVDMTDLDTGESIHITDLKLPEGVTSVAMAQGEGHDQAIASIHTPRGDTTESSEEEGEEGESESEE